MSVLTLDQAKTHLQLSLDDHDPDDELTAFIAATEASLVTAVGPIEPTEVTRRISGGTYTLVLPVSPAIELTTVTPYSGTALTVGDLYLDPTTGLVTNNNMSPFVAAYYTVVYSAGRATCPPDLLMAVKELLRHLWKTQRGQVARPGLMGDDLDPQINNRAAGVLYGEALWPQRVRQLVEPHRQVVAG